MPDFVTMGELLIDFVSSKKGCSVKDAPGFIPAPGGAPANVAVGIARLGGNVGFIGKVGRDPFGQKLEGVLKENRVDTAGLSFSDRARTMLAFVSLTEEGERDFVFYRHPSADMFITEGDIPQGYLNGVRVFHFGSIGLISEPSRGTTELLIKKAKNAGALVSFDPNIRLSLWQDERRARDEIAAIIPQTDIVKLSRDEALFITGIDHPKEAARMITAMGPRLAVVTMGAKGSVGVTARYGVEMEGFTVEVCDTTGAGDAFMAGMLVKIGETGKRDLATLSDLELISIFSFANAAGALTTTLLGAIPALPDRARVEEFLRTHKNRKRPLM